MSRSRAILGNAAVQAASQALTWSLTWILLKVMPSHLGEAGFGRLFFALSFGMIASAITNLGVDTHLTRAVAASGEADARTAIADALGLRVLLCLVSYAGQVALIHLLPYDAQMRALVSVVALATCLESVALTFGAVFIGANRMRPPAACLVLNKLVLTVLVCLCARAGSGLGAFAWAHAAAAAAQALLAAVLLQRSGLLVVRFSAADLLRTAKLCLPFTVWIVFGEIYVRTAVMMLSALSREEVLGWFGTAFRLYGTLLFVPHIFNTAVFPTLARMGRGDEDGAFGVAGERLLSYVLLVSVPLAAGGAFLAGPLLGLLYGGGFAGARLPLEILSVSSAVVCVDVFLGSLLIAKGLEKPWALMAVAAAVFNPLANLLLIPLGERLWGNAAAGAAVSTLLTEVLMFAGALRLLPAGVLSARGWLTFARVLLASGAMVAGLHWTPLPFPAASAPGVAMAAVLGAAYYAAAALLVRAVPADHAAHLVHALKSRRKA